MKTTITKVEHTEVEVDLPAACPGCGKDFSGDDALIACGWMAVEQTCHLAPDGERVDWDQETEDFYEIQVTTGYKCAACKQLVAGEDC